MQKEKTLSTNEVSSDIKKYVRVKQAAEYLGVSTNHVYRLAEKPCGKQYDYDSRKRYQNPKKYFARDL